jgi:hypothetical protein
MISDQSWIFPWCQYFVALGKWVMSSILDSFELRATPPIMRPKPRGPAMISDSGKELIKG